MFEYLPLNPSPAAESAAGEGERRLVLFGLATCAYCRRAKAFLEREGLPFRWIYLDEVASDLKEKAKAEFKNKFLTPLVFPTLLLNGDDYLTGFIEASWRMELLGRRRE